MKIVEEFRTIIENYWQRFLSKILSYDMMKKENPMKSYTAYGHPVLRRFIKQ